MLGQSDVMPPMLLDRDRALHRSDGFLDEPVRPRRDAGLARGITRPQAGGLVCVVPAITVFSPHLIMRIPQGGSA